MRRMGRRRSDNWIGIIYWTAIFTLAMLRLAKADEPKVRFTAQPVASLAPARITFRLSIENADDKLYCPGIRWLLPNDTVAYEESDCDPDGDHKWQSWTKRLLFGPGEHTVTVELVKAKKVIQRYAVTVRVS